MIIFPIKKFYFLFLRHPVTKNLIWNVPKYFIIEMGAQALQKTNLFCPQKACNDSLKTREFYNLRRKKQTFSLFFEHPISIPIS